MPEIDLVAGKGVTVAILPPLIQTTQPERELVPPTGSNAGLGVNSILTGQIYPT